MLAIGDSKSPEIGEVTSQQSMVTIRSPCCRAWCRTLQVNW